MYDIRSTVTVALHRIWLVLTDKFKEFDSSFSKALRAEVSWHMGAVAVTIKEFFDDLPCST